MPKRKVTFSNENRIISVEEDVAGEPPNRKMKSYNEPQSSNVDEGSSVSNKCNSSLVASDGETAGPLQYESKHTLDSDEEEDQKYEKLNVQDVEGQEEKTIDFDEEIKITPFNMLEEMDEGHFDSEGNFIFNRNSEDMKDAWLDNIDWGKVKKDAGHLWDTEEQAYNLQADGAGDSASPSPVDRMEIFANILEFMKPGETVTRTLKRLGGNKSSIESRQRRRTNVIKLTELVNLLVSDGLFEVYGYTYEKFNFELKNVDESQLYKNEIAAKRARKSESEDDTGVQWEFKWTDDESAPVYGPHSTQQMLNWTKDGYFKNGVMVRRYDEPNARFYSSKRIDFELYM
ncbi:CD2 antigen cytoplasmic tail-binding protein [Trichinella spiralis]|uniref:CD2 antigen cytoplasmic tail-binding protein n=1 Tax=Trichinella spiralis TaxID=6334 RepID=A0ABR3KN36_TRISP